MLLSVAIILSWFTGAVVVRVGLDWSDTFAYSPASEWRYLGVAVVALTVATLGTTATIRAFRATRRRRG